MNKPHLREECARRLDQLLARPAELCAFVGFDGFVDSIVHAVDKRIDASTFTRLPTIASFGERIAAAAGKSTNIELVPQRKKLGGNGPIMANALAQLGLKVTYVGALGMPEPNPVFAPLLQKAVEVKSIAESGHTDAVEFLDGKVMLVKSVSLNDVTWASLTAHYGREKFQERMATCHLVALINWVMTPAMSQIWEVVLREVCPSLEGPRRQIFFDLCDPEKRAATDIARALELIGDFQKYFDVTLGLNEKEACEIAEVLGIAHGDLSPDGLSEMACRIYDRLHIDTLVVHPVSYALAVHGRTVNLVQGPYIPKPVITTGAGDHFNAGFCTGKLLGLDNEQCVLMGVSTSGYYVMTGQSPVLADLAGLMRNWPAH